MGALSDCICGMLLILDLFGAMSEKKNAVLKQFIKLIISQFPETHPNSHFLPFLKWAHGPSLSNTGYTILLTKAFLTSLL